MSRKRTGFTVPFRQHFEIRFSHAVRRHDAAAARAAGMSSPGSLLCSRGGPGPGAEHDESPERIEVEFDPAGAAFKPEHELPGVRLAVMF